MNIGSISTDTVGTNRGASSTSIAIRLIASFLSALSIFSNVALADDVGTDVIDRTIVGVEPKVISWRRDIHQHPELSNQELRTSKLVADHLRKLGFEVTTGVARTGVIGVLHGASPGPAIALRADMDALPVTETTGLPFASKERVKLPSGETGVMHACGHDAHTAMLMGAAEVLAGLRSQLHGTVKFIFQPAEEASPSGPLSGSALMIEEGALRNDPVPTAIFGMHVWPGEPGTIYLRSRGIMAAADVFTIDVSGVQAHGGEPWRGVDAISVAAQMITALQMIPSRQLDVSSAPAVITIGTIRGGSRENILPGSTELKGTIRTFDPAMRDDLLARFQRTAKFTAETVGATARVTIKSYAPVTYNDPQLTEQLTRAMERAAGPGKVREARRVMGAEDFSRYAEVIPGLFILLGINKPNVPEDGVASNHSSDFFVNEDALVTGVRAFVFVALDRLHANEPPEAATAHDFKLLR